MNTALLANFAAAAGSLCAGASVVATRVAVGETDPFTLAFYRYIIGALCFAPVLPLLWPRLRIPLSDWIKIALLGVLFFGFFPWAFSAALQYTTAARGAIGLATMPVQTLIVAAIFGREQLSGRKLASVVLAFVGIAAVFGPAAFRGEATSYLIGDALMLIGALSAAIYSAFSRPVFSAYGAMFVTAIGMVFGLVSLSLPAIAHGALSYWPHFTLHGWIALGFLGTVGAVVQFSLFNWALRWLPPSRVVIYLTLNPIVAMLLGTLLLGETITVFLVVGLAFVISGILVANAGVGRSPKPS